MTPETRTIEQIRADIESERTALAGAVEDLRQATDVTAKLKAKLPLIIGVAAILVALRIALHRLRD
ncbi:MAG TPA: DUF3618 domain-containing protein [Gaiellaceae bacterium]|nr:DUF3618 domain-containing protein [Gaiellaceae bacterium]